MRKLTDADAGNLYAMKVLKKATLKGELQTQFAAYVDFTVCFRC